MGTVTLSKQNRLYWLGRYAERVYTTIQYMFLEYDRMLDGADMDFAGFCTKMGIPCPYTSGEDFARRYTFDGEDPNSIRASVDAMLGNGMVLREVLTSPTLAYLQMAQAAIEMAEKSQSPSVELQWVLDDIMAFRGSFDDTVAEESIRNITKSGGLVERISLMIRLNWRLEGLEREAQKLVSRLPSTGLTPNEEACEILKRKAAGGEEVSSQELLWSVENLFSV